MKRIYDCIAACRLGSAFRLAALLLFPTPVLAELSCQTLGWLNAVVEATTPASRDGGERQITRRLDSLYARVDLDALDQRMHMRTPPKAAGEIMSFVRAAKASAARGEAAVRSPSFITQRSKALTELRRLPCDVSSSRAEKAASDRIFNGDRKTSFLDRLRSQLRTQSVVESDSVIFVLAAMGSFGLLALALTRTSRNQRRSKRFPCYLEARMQFDEDWIEVTVLDLSLGGCRIMQKELTDVGMRGAISLSGTERRMKVIWNATGTAGIQFDRDLPEQELQAILSGRNAEPDTARVA